MGCVCRNYCGLVETVAGVFWERSGGILLLFHEHLGPRRLGPALREWKIQYLFTYYIQRAL
jgi:hypothetical protein